MNWELAKAKAKAGSLEAHQNRPERMEADSTDGKKSSTNLKKHKDPHAKKRVDGGGGGGSMSSMSNTPPSDSVVNKETKKDLGDASKSKKRRKT